MAHVIQRPHAEDIIMSRFQALQRDNERLRNENLRTFKENG